MAAFWTRRTGALAAALALCCLAEGAAYGLFGRPARPSASYERLSVAEAWVRIRTTPSLLVVDVRTPEEYAEGHIPGAINIPLDTLGDEQPAELPEGAGGVTFTFPDNKAAAQGNVRVMFYDGPSIDKGSTDIWSWPVAQSDVVKETLPAGDYYAVTLIGEEPTTATCKIYNGDGWVDFDIANEAIRDKGAPIHVEAGKTVELSASGLA